MVSPNKIKKLHNSDPRAEDRQRMQDQLSCSICPPNRGENAKRRSKHGNRKARHKDHFRNDFRKLDKRERDWAVIMGYIDEHDLREDEYRRTTAPCCGMHLEDCGCDYTPAIRKQG